MMSIKVCGREIRPNKIIKVYTIFRHLNLLLVLGALGITPVFAADLSSPCKNSSSSAGAVPCLPLNAPRPDGVSPPSHKGPPVQTQRAAGSSSLPAMALVMALGVRTVQGPVEFTPPNRRAAPTRVAMEK